METLYYCRKCNELSRTITTEEELIDELQEHYGHSVVCNYVKYPNEVVESISIFIQNANINEYLEKYSMDNLIFLLRFTDIVKYDYKASKCVCGKRLGYCFDCKKEFCLCHDLKHFKHSYILYFEKPKCKNYSNANYLQSKHEKLIRNENKLQEDVEYSNYLSTLDPDEFDFNSMKVLNKINKLISKQKPENEELSKSLGSIITMFKDLNWDDDLYDMEQSSSTLADKISKREVKCKKLATSIISNRDNRESIMLKKAIEDHEFQPKIEKIKLFDVDFNECGFIRYKDCIPFVQRKKDEQRYLLVDSHDHFALKTHLGNINISSSEIPKNLGIKSVKFMKDGMFILYANYLEFMMVELRKKYVNGDLEVVNIGTKYRVNDRIMIYTDHHPKIIHSNCAYISKYDCVERVYCRNPDKFKTIEIYYNGNVIDTFQDNEKISIKFPKFDNNWNFGCYKLLTTYNTKIEFMAMPSRYENNNGHHRLYESISPDYEHYWYLTKDSEDDEMIKYSWHTMDHCYIGFNISTFIGSKYNDDPNYGVLIGDEIHSNNNYSMKNPFRNAYGYSQYYGKNKIMFFNVENGRSIVIDM